MSFIPLNPVAPVLSIAPKGTPGLYSTLLSVSQSGNVRFRAETSGCPVTGLQAIAGENNLAATAFLIRQGEDYRLRWFTPTTELPLFER